MLSPFLNWRKRSPSPAAGIIPNSPIYCPTLANRRANQSKAFQTLEERRFLPRLLVSAAILANGRGFGGQRLLRRVAVQQRVGGDAADPARADQSGHAQE